MNLVPRTDSLWQCPHPPATWNLTTAMSDDAIQFMIVTEGGRFGGYGLFLCPAFHWWGKTDFFRNLGWGILLFGLLLLLPAVGLHVVLTILLARAASTAKGSNPSLASQDSNGLP